jgi:hypothetical protein
VNASEARDSTVAAEAVEPMDTMDDAVIETPGVEAEAGETAAMPEMPGLPSISDGQGNTWAIWQAGHAGQQQTFISRARRGVDSQDMYIATSTDAFTSSTVAAVTSDEAEHADPAVFINSEDGLCPWWMDTRDGSIANVGSPQER